MTAGDIILVDGGHNFLSKAIKFFARSNWSHTALGAFRYDGDDMVFEAEELVILDFWNGGKNRTAFQVYSWSRPDHQQAAAEVVDVLTRELNGKIYGFAQLLWFVYRWIIKSLRLPHRLAVHNWFPGGRICTEVVYIAIEGTCTKIGYPFYYEYDSNAVTPADIEQICERLEMKGLLRKGETK